jgi:hypothetical protein
MCGTDTITWTDLLMAQNTIAINRDTCWRLVMDNPYMDTFTTDMYYEGPRGLIISDIFESPTVRVLPTLFDALRWYCTKESTQPEDREYGLVGLTTAGIDPRFIPDYARGSCQIYIDAAVYIIETTRKLDIICLMQARRWEQWLPSGVPDWLNGTPTWPLNYWAEAFAASVDRKAMVSFASNGSILVVKELYITSIAKTGKALILSDNDENLKDDDANGISKLVTSFHEWRKLLGPNVYMEDLQAFCRTFTSGGIIEKLDPFPELSQHCTAQTMLGIFAQLSRRTMPDSDLGVELCALADKMKLLAPVDQI